MEEVASRRWPGGVECPKCGSRDVARRKPQKRRRWPQWRCRACRRDFTALTGHPQRARSRRPAAGIAADDVRVRPAAQRPTAAGLSAGARRTLAVLRRRPDGATAAKISELSGLSLSQTHRTLRNFAERGWACRRDGTVRDGHQLRGTNLWQIVHSDECLAALASLPAESFPMPPLPQPDMVPPEFWHLFWSGLQGSDLRIGEHAEHIGGVMIGSNDLSAEAWALRHLPTDALMTLHRARTRTGSPSGRLLAATIRHRAGPDA